CFRPVFETPSVGKCVDPEAENDLRSLHARHQAQRPLEGVRGKDQEQHVVVKGWATQTESPRACTSGAADESGKKRCVRL
ncbi:unnamed protein product, partial [Ectocarpus fasciculatus]